MRQNRQVEAGGFEVFVPGKPTAWARARVSRAGGFFTPASQRAYRATIQRHLRLAKAPHHGRQPVEVNLCVYLPQAKSNRDAFPIGRNTSDADNWAKMFLDAMNGVVFHDDSQVVSLNVQKLWADDALGVGVWVSVHPVT